jgi:Family of unknown function (DUF5996)
VNETISDVQETWPTLPLEEWIETKETIHRYCQIVGKIRMTLVPFRNHWWHVTLYVDTRGLTTGPMPTGDGRTVEIVFDIVAHHLIVSTSDGKVESFPILDGLTCMDFYTKVFTALHNLRVRVAINPAPYELPGPLLSEDRDHRTYDAKSVATFWTILRHIDSVLESFAGRFNGKQSPIHLFWHSFDLAMARYSGRAAPTRPDANRVNAEAYSHEVISFGFWAGDDRVPYPAFYSYTAPAPPGLAEQPLRPAGAEWDAESGTAFLPYDSVRRAAVPRNALLDFFGSTYEAGAICAKWDIAAFATHPVPPRSGR